MILIPLFLSFHFLLLVLCDGSTFQVLASEKDYGPDGPWQAVSVSIGEPGQPIDLYPGGIFGSPVLTPEVCSTYSTKPCGSGGVFDANLSYTYDNISIGFGQSSSDCNFAEDAINFDGLNSLVMDNMRIKSPGIGAQTALAQNFSISLMSKLGMIYPDGTSYPPQLGYLSLGPQINQTFSSDPPINASLVPGTLKEQGVISSNSFGLHIGSAILKLPLSLWFGGYDSSRLIGDVSTEPVNDQYGFQIDVLDISIGVSSGGSPFPHSSRTGILTDRNASIGSTLPVLINPAAPYLSLPNSTCASIIQDLPVTYQEKYGLFTWNVADPGYTQIINSPSLLNFTFRALSIPSGNLTISVPFRLLNLTLEAPLTSSPIIYFPCQPPQYGQRYSLGRAFLQAAFIGANWDRQSRGEWYLAQAPGPNIPSLPSDVPFADTVSSPPSNNLQDSWKGLWTPLPETRSSMPGSTLTATSLPAASSDPAKSSNGLSAGGKVGVGVSLGLFFLFAVGATVFFFQRRSRRKYQLRQGHAYSQEMESLHANSAELEIKGQDGPEGQAGIDSFQPKKDSGQNEVREIFEAPGPNPTELANSPNLRYEMPTSPIPHFSPSRRRSGRSL